MAKTWPVCSVERGLDLVNNHGWFTSTQIVELLVGAKQDVGPSAWKACLNSVYKRLWRVCQDETYGTQTLFDEPSVLQIDRMILKDVDGVLTAFPGGQGQVIASDRAAELVIDDMQQHQWPPEAKCEPASEWMSKVAIVEAIGRDVSRDSVTGWISRCVHDNDKSLFKVNDADNMPTWHVRTSIANHLIEFAAGLPALGRGWWTSCDPYKPTAPPAAEEPDPASDNERANGYSVAIGDIDITQGLLSEAITNLAEGVSRGDLQASYFVLRLAMDRKEAAHAA